MRTNFLILIFVAGLQACSPDAPQTAAGATPVDAEQHARDLRTQSAILGREANSDRAGAAQRRAADAAFIENLMGHRSVEQVLDGFPLHSKKRLVPTLFKMGLKIDGADLSLDRLAGVNDRPLGDVILSVQISGKVKGLPCGLIDFLTEDGKTIEGAMLQVIYRDEKP